jgi:hypothetical protein
VKESERKGAVKDTVFNLEIVEPALVNKMPLLTIAESHITIWAPSLSKNAWYFFKSTYLYYSKRT